MDVLNALLQKYYTLLILQRGTSEPAHASVVAWLETLPRPILSSSSSNTPPSPETVHPSATSLSNIDPTIITLLTSELCQALCSDINAYDTVMKMKNDARHNAHTLAASARKKGVLKKLVQIDQVMRLVYYQASADAAATAGTAAAGTIAADASKSTGNVGDVYEEQIQAMQHELGETYDSQSPIDYSIFRWKANNSVHSLCTQLHADPAYGASLLCSAEGPVKTDIGLHVLCKGLAHLVQVQQGEGEEGEGGIDNGKGIGIGQGVLSCTIQLESLSERIDNGLALEYILAAVSSICEASLAGYGNAHGQVHEEDSVDLEAGNTDTNINSCSSSSSSSINYERYTHECIQSGYLHLTMRQSLSDATLQRVHRILSRAVGGAGTYTIRKEGTVGGVVNILNNSMIASNKAVTHRDTAAEKSRNGKKRTNKDGAEDSMSIKVKNTLSLCPIL